MAPPKATKGPTLVLRPVFVWSSTRTGAAQLARASDDLARLEHARVRFDRPKIEAWLATRGEHYDRADWAVVRAEDGAFLGEAVLSKVDLDNESANYRVLARRAPGLRSRL